MLKKTEAIDEQAHNQAIKVWYKPIAIKRDCKLPLKISVKPIKQLSYQISLVIKKGRFCLSCNRHLFPVYYKTIWFDAYGNSSNTVANLSTANEIHIDLMTVNGIEIQIFKGDSIRIFPISTFFVGLF